LRRYLVKRLQSLGYAVTLSPRNPDDRAAWSCQPSVAKKLSRRSVPSESAKYTGWLRFSEQERRKVENESGIRTVRRPESFLLPEIDGPAGLNYNRQGPSDFLNAWLVSGTLLRALCAWRVGALPM